ncbi:lytic transglycosylase domain-containing protein [Pseudomonas sp. NPDC088444]|uniref:lytic transglycosylase domain-containing protein n=1 Tax=Pseudomonas sp. NPDC088444 TaxID=3364456 RepID=UPI00385037FA
MDVERAFRGVLLTLCILPLAAEADVYISRTADGGIIISNVKRAGREVQRVFHEPVSVPAFQAAAPALAGRDEKSMTVSQRPYAQEVSQAAASNDLPEALLHAVIRIESGYNPSALSVKGAAGLMQLMPDTARDMGVTNVWDPRSNIQGGARYLKQLMVMFGNDVSLAVAAYNAGPAAVSKRGNVIPPFAETRRYVPDVLRDYHRLLGDAGTALAN